MQKYGQLRQKYPKLTRKDLLERSDLNQLTVFFEKPVAYKICKSMVNCVKGGLKINHNHAGHHAFLKAF